ncbi:MAG: hypothetical protein NC548_05975 [Lachnospiraceae bacterium]|nr:hypothetical protein [Lachnospiraceae bacterium]
MAKKPVNPYIEQLIGYAKMNSLLRQFSDATIIAPEPFDGREFVYMAPREDTPFDRFALLSIPAELFRGYLVNTVELSAFNKYLKKTMTECEQNSDRSLIFKTPGKGVDGGDAACTLNYLGDIRQFTSKYHKLFKDQGMTAQAMQQILATDNWRTIDDALIAEIQDNQLTPIELDNGEWAYVTKAIFGPMRKTGQIQYCTLRSEGDTSVVMFRQREEYGDIYHIMRFIF